MTDSFLHNHQSALDSQREEAEINWLFPEDEENFPPEEYEPTDEEMMASFGTIWYDWL